MTKGLCLAFVVLSYVIANSKTPILDMMSYSWGIISGSFLAPYALSLYWKGINRAGAWAGIIGGFATALPPLLAQLFFPSASLPFFGPLKGLGPHFACLAMLVSLLLCWVVSGIGSRMGLKSAAPNPAFYEKRGWRTRCRPEMIDRAARPFRVCGSWPRAPVDMKGGRLRCSF